VHITLWILTAILATAFTVGGLSQILLTKQKYRSVGASQHWVDDFGPGHLKAIGATKVTGSLGLILPGALGIVPVLVPIAASCLALVMAGAATTRFRRSEWTYMVGDVVYLGLFAFVAWGRFDLHPL